MKKEYVAVGILGLFLLGYVFDYVSGSINIVLKSPFDYVNPDLLSRYPFTTVSIIIKTLALFSTILLVLSFFKKKLVVKGLVILFIAAMFVLYSIQQLATGLTLIPIEWTMTLTWTGLLLVAPALIYIIVGIIYLAIDKAFKTTSQDEA
ncbi:MAG: hypothetical protein UR68_C0020G0016 [Candidatus Roizmanbacteria bacterium GW2011_GWA2_35_19]|uniref:Uncharacterized protein n=2 Tax=Candidatus Roizmaniibacteriota TaxID=1752723 RepID=A0A0G0C7N0_9BACT|nr:MAG: hypothetical protein UR63_C0007G0016 [Candidatus Roizmanbacteria bacterium GW2011_GWC2_35_12]KKP72161.1 MAG: hypothetical protein UR68_C0020G0016 [Candidatus Roizmanbacteria bacterium GW2011_GWA2_35_19]